MRPIEPARVSKVVDHAGSFRIRRVILPIGALLLICPAETLFAQTDPGQFIERNSSRLAIVSKNQLLAPEKALRAIQRAHAEIASGHIEAAEKDLARALEIAPHFALAKVMQGAIDIDRGNFDASSTLFQQAIDDDPALGGAYVGIAVVLIHEQRFKAALPLLDRAEGLLPGAWFVHFAKAWAQMELGNIDVALKQADIAEQIAGTDAGERSAVSYLRAIASLHLNDLAAARKHLVEAIARDRGGQYAALANTEMERLETLQTARR
jgi:tetratricopeptide (TPR) repeat protein